MYHSRLFLTNGVISLELDALNGEVLGFIRESTMDNAAKNYFRDAAGILDGNVFVAGVKKHLNVPRFPQISEDTALTPQITVEQGEGSAKAEIIYPYLVANGEKIDISAKVRIELDPGDCRSRWYLSLDNRSGCEIQSCKFPQLNGLWLGDDWKENTLIFPRVAGLKMDDPTGTLAQPPVRMTWKWQEYLHNYFLGSQPAAKDDRGLYTLSANHTGGCSMLWMDLYSREEGTGIYITCRNLDLRQKAISACTLGPYNPGVGLGIDHFPCLTEGQWESQECVLAFHEGDWHWAADEYRAARQKNPNPVCKNEPVPEWFKKSPGLVAHYDFMYQGGKVVHTFKDIPALYEKAKSQGYKHLLIAGWNDHGFDDGFPLYRPSAELGTEEELKKAIADIKADGGHVCFYVNSRLCNVGYPQNKERTEKSCAMNRDGSLKIENYGAKGVDFATLCMSEPSWRKQLVEDITYLVKEIGIDSVYLDQLAMATSVLCYHPEHKDHAGDPAAWNQGYEKLLDELRTAVPECPILYEGCCDVFGSGVAAQLISTIRRPAVGAMAEVYKYTFPEQILTDMLNPRRYSAMRAEHTARKSTWLLYNSFVIGSYFWCYDLEEDNTFSRDPAQEERMKKTVALRQAWLNRWGHGIFRDQENLMGIRRNGNFYYEKCTDELFKTYKIEKGMLVACADEKGLEGQLCLAWEGSKKVQITLLTEENLTPAIKKVKVKDGFIRLDLPQTELALFAIEEI